MRGRVFGRSFRLGTSICEPVSSKSFTSCNRHELARSKALCRTEDSEIRILMDCYDRTCKVLLPPDFESLYVPRRLINQQPIELEKPTKFAEKTGFAEKKTRRKWTVFPNGPGLIWHSPIEAIHILLQAHVTSRFASCGDPHLRKSIGTPRTGSILVQTDRS